MWSITAIDTRIGSTLFFVPPYYGIAKRFLKTNRVRVVIFSIPRRTVIKQPRRRLFTSPFIFAVDPISTTTISFRTALIRHALVVWIYLRVSHVIIILGRVDGAINTCLGFHSKVIAKKTVSNISQSIDCNQTAACPSHHFKTINFRATHRYVTQINWRTCESIAIKNKAAL